MKILRQTPLFLVFEGVIFLAWCTAVQAAPAAVEVVQGPGLPFSRRELEEAVALRWSPPAASSEAVQVRVWAVEPGTVVLGSGRSERNVVVGDARGPAAARVVALLLVDLLEAETPGPGAPAIAIPTASEGLATDVRTSRALSAPRVQTARDTGAFHLGLEGLFAPGLVGTVAGWGLGARVSYDVSSRFEVLAAVGYARARQESALQLTLDSIPLRVGLGVRGAWRAWRVSVGAGPAARLYSATGTGAQSQRGSSPGLFSSLMLVGPSAWRLSPYLVAAVDFWATAVAWRQDGEVREQARSVSPSLSLGIQSRW